MKTVLVTGGNRGIGLEICRQLDEHGYIVILGSRDLKKGIKAASSFSRNVIVKQLDVTQEKSIQRLFEFVKTEFSNLDVLINNAGIARVPYVPVKTILLRAINLTETHLYGVQQMRMKIVQLLRKSGVIKYSKSVENVENVSLKPVKQIMETNFFGAWRMIQVFLPLLLKSEAGRIINISSGFGEFKNLSKDNPVYLSGDNPGYSLSKSSLNALTIMLSNELMEKGIKVNAMCPGRVKTDMGPHNIRHVSEGADTAVWLTTEKEIPTGKFFRDRREINW